MSKPEIRLKGFDGEWNYSCFKDLYYPNTIKNDLLFDTDRIISVANMYFNPGNVISDKDYLRTYNIFRLGDIAFEGNKSKNYAHGRFVENTIGDGIVSHVFKVFSPKNEEYDLNYWKYAINNEKVMSKILVRCTKASTMMTDLVEKDFLKEYVYHPLITEQKKIGDFLNSLDLMIQITAKKISSLKQMKSASLISMFPQLGETTPRVRFKGYVGNWDKKSFGELYEHNVVKNDLSFGVDKVISVANMYYNPNTFISDDNYLRTYNIFRLGDIAFEGNKSKNFAHGRFVENTIGDGIVSHVFEVFSPRSSEYDLDFWKYAINNERLMGQVLVRCTKASTMMTNLVARDFLKESFLVPTYDEQKKIGSYFRCLDKQISMQEQRLEKLKQIKAACLDKMFV